MSAYVARGLEKTMAHETHDGMTAHTSQDRPSPQQRDKPAGTTGDHQTSGQQDQGKPTDYLSNERTFLAWTRTGVALVALGFVVARFGLLLRELAQRAGATATATSTQHGSSVLGAIIVALAAALLAVSYIRYRSIGRAIERGEYRDSRWLAATVTIITVLVALLLTAYLLFT